MQHAGDKRCRCGTEERVRELEERVDELQDALLLLEMDAKEAAELAGVAQADALILRQRCDELDRLCGAQGAQVKALEGQADALKEWLDAEVVEHEACKEQLQGGRTSVRSLMRSVGLLSERVLKERIRGLNVAGMCIRVARQSSSSSSQGGCAFAIASDSFEDRVFFGWGGDGQPAFGERFAAKVTVGLLVCLPGTQPFECIGTMSGGGGDGGEEEYRRLCERYGRDRCLLPCSGVEVYEVRVDQVREAMLPDSDLSD